MAKYKLMWVNEDGMPIIFATRDVFTDILKARREACGYVSKNPKGILSIDSDRQGILYSEGYVSMKSKNFVWTTDEGKKYNIRADGSVGSIYRTQKTKSRK